ncbi:MAG: hypothetical protein EOS50_01540 [Mesorhizobium sp.]|nr:MAG: hypothetical protein EOS50_01540 [Mesorhizobium sp.]
MSEQKAGKLKQLKRLLPAGLLVDSAWLSARGYSTTLRTKCVASGRLPKPFAISPQHSPPIVDSVSRDNGIISRSPQVCVELGIRSRRECWLSARCRT